MAVNITQINVITVAENMFCFHLLMNICHIVSLGFKGSLSLLDICPHFFPGANPQMDIFLCRVPTSFQAVEKAESVAKEAASAQAHPRYPRGFRVSGAAEERLVQRKTKHSQCFQLRFWYVAMSCLPPGFTRWFLGRNRVKLFGIQQNWRRFLAKSFFPHGLSPPPRPVAASLQAFLPPLPQERLGAEGGKDPEAAIWEKTGRTGGKQSRRHKARAP